MQDESDPALDSAQRQQLASLSEREAAGEKVGGWKLGLTSGGARDAFGPGVRPFGFILASRIFDSGDSLDWTRIGNGGIENEVCFVLRDDITSPVDAADVIDYLTGVAPAFEINQRRIPADSSPPDRIADDLSNWGIVVGSVVPIPGSWDPESLRVRLCHEGVAVEEVSAAGHIDDHFDSLARLANRLLRFGRSLKAGEKVITGAFGRVASPEKGRWSGDFGAEIGRVEINIV